MHLLQKLPVWLLLLILCGCQGQSAVNAAESLDFEHINRFSHDPRAFTQGLLFHDGFLYESTGLYGRSTVRKVEAETGSVVASHSLERRFFGEGLALVDEQLVQLTWREGLAHVYDRQTLKPLNILDYKGEGWGLVSHGDYLIRSDGTATLFFHDPATFAEIKSMVVRERGKPVTRLNELEMMQGELLANILGSDRIARIDIDTGDVTGWIDLSSLRQRQGAWRKAKDLNGIAYDEAGDRLFVTGKNWPWLYEIRIAAPLPPATGQ